MLDAKAGDELILHQWGGMDGSYSLEKVERVTATQIVLTTGGKYRRSDGREVGGRYNGWNGASLLARTPENMRKYERFCFRNARRERLRALRDLVVDLTRCSWRFDISDAVLADAEAALQRMWHDRGPGKWAAWEKGEQDGN